MPPALGPTTAQLTWSISTAIAGKLLAGGAVLADDGATPVGSLIVFDCEDRAEVEAFLAADPFTKAGLFASVAIYPWRKVFFAGARGSLSAARIAATSEPTIGILA